MTVTNAGVDTNVFNEPDALQPKSDFTMTLSPQLQGWLRIGRTWATATVKEDYLWYQKYVSERSLNNSYTAGFLAPLTRVSFAANGSWLNTHERPGFEIDTRSDRTETAFDGAFELRALSRTLLGVRGRQLKVDFRDTARFGGSSLHDELNRTSTSVGATLRHELTPLTSLMLDVARVQDRFDFRPDRDTDSTEVGLNIRFDPAALIDGSAQIGYRDFQPHSPTVPRFKGPTAAVDLGYIAAGSTKLGLRVIRNVQYSFDANQPYYLLSGFTASIAQQLFGPVDVTARLGLDRLSYRDLEDAVVSFPDRVDRIRTYGGGTGFRVGPSFRIGFEVDQSKRESSVAERQYHGLRYGVSLTYGTPGR
jgi:hypothetical protein